MRLTSIALVVLALPLSAATGWAKGDTQKGQLLTYTCTGCHGVAEYKNAYPQYHVPKIAGQSEQYLVAALKAYRSGERSHPTMRAQALSFSDQDIEDIAAFVSAGTPTGGAK